MVLFPGVPFSRSLLGCFPSHPSGSSQRGLIRLPYPGKVLASPSLLLCCRFLCSKLRCCLLIDCLCLLLKCKILESKALPTTWLAFYLRCLSPVLNWYLLTRVMNFRVCVRVNSLDLLYTQARPKRDVSASLPSMEIKNFLFTDYCKGLIAGV